MDRDKAFDIVSGYLAEEFEIPRQHITLKAHLYDDLDLDSIDALDMIAVLEDELGVEIEDEEVKQIRTVGDVVQFILSKTEG